jgi:hypothetical protein
MKKILLLTLSFCAAILLTVKIQQPTQVRSREAEVEQYEKNDKENRFDEPLQFFQFHQGIRTAEDQPQPLYKPGYKTLELNAAQKRAQAFNFARTERTNGLVEFKERGPSNVPGRTRTILVLPGDPNQNTWLAGSATGGIWKTTNGGTTWTEKSADFPVYPISSLAMSTSDTNTVYAGTGEFVSSIYSAVGDGIFKSSDKGETWTQLSSTAGNHNFAIVTRVIVNPANVNVLLASTAPSSLSTGQTSKIMRSSDGGNSWTMVYQNTNEVEQLIASPADFNIQYAAINGVGVAKSIDGGATWNISNTGMVPTGRVEIGVSPANPNRLYASCQGTRSGNGSDLYLSNDAGATWTLVDVRFNNNVLDFLNGQGFYDNHVLCDPFNQDIVYFGGVDTFRSTIGTGTTTIDDYKFTETNTQGFLSLIQFNNPGFFIGGRLQVGSASNKRTVEIRFGPGINQNAHRFLTPVDSTSGVSVSKYTYTDYTQVPLQAWDVTAPASPKQLMVSFRDQSRNGKLDFLPQNFDPTRPLENSREYLYIHNADYNVTTPLFAPASTGGQETQLAYAFFPSLPAGGTWTPNSLPTSTLKIEYAGLSKINATTVTVSDDRSQYDLKNKQSQVNMEAGGIHPDHHFSAAIITSVPNKTYKILLTTDGGTFVSNNSTTPGIVDGNWTFTGNGFNTSQFYGADKKPGADEYLGGMQDNGTRISTSGESASKTTSYRYAIGGDGFEVLWHSIDGNKVIGSLYNNTFYRSTNGGVSWSPAFSGFPLVSSSPDPDKYPFVSKLAHSRNVPEIIYSVGSDGVWKSSNFGGLWTLTPITNKWGTVSTFFDVEVSRANANIVWGGAGMTTQRNLHVSTNAGTTFTPTNNYTATTLGFITKLASHPTQPNTAYALFSFYGKPKILRTKDLGQNWTDISGFNTGSVSTNGFPDVATYCLYVMPDNPNVIWAGTEIGIVESQDEGATWALLNDFPNVSVWDMKGQDEQIVIATHGRGIWTAKMTSNQNPVQRPQLLSMGTRPNQDLAVRFQLLNSYDSLQVFIKGQRIGKLNAFAVGTYDLNVRNVQPGTNIEVSFVGFKDGSPIQSASLFGNHFRLYTPYTKQYSNLMTASTDFVISPFGGFTISNFGTSNQSLQSTHPYPGTTESTAMLSQPIIVANTSTNFFYQDVAIVQSSPGVNFGQPGFKDFVVVEATKNGLDWIPLKDGYSASANAAWQTAFSGNQPGTPAMQVDQSIDIKTKFATNDTLLFRFRLKADTDQITGWGWSIDNLFIQQPPTGVELSEPVRDLTIFPNPTGGKSKIQFTLIEDTQITIETLDAKGNSIGSQLSEKLPAGNHEQNIDLTEQANGLYYIRMKSNKKSTTVKLIKK